RRPTAGEVVAFARRPGVVPATVTGMRELSAPAKPAAIAAPTAASSAPSAGTSGASGAGLSRSPGSGTSVVGVVESVQRTPRSHAAPKPRLLRTQVLAALLIPVVVALVAGVLTFVDA